MKIELNILAPYILIYIIVGIIFIKTIINFFIENKYPILQNISPKDKNLIQNLKYKFLKFPQAEKSKVSQKCSLHLIQMLA